MKKVMFRLTLMFGLAFMAATQVLQAQQPLLVNIPFAFTAGKTVLPPGQYRVEKWSTSGMLLKIQSTDNSDVVFVLAMSAETTEPQHESKLIFHRYANEYFLSQVWSGGSKIGRQLPKSDREKRQALALARYTSPDEVTIVARLTPPKQ